MLEIFFSPELSAFYSMGTGVLSRGVKSHLQIVPKIRITEALPLIPTHIFVTLEIFTFSLILVNALCFDLLPSPPPALQHHTAQLQPPPKTLYKQEFDQFTIAPVNSKNVRKRTIDYWTCYCSLVPVERAPEFWLLHRGTIYRVYLLISTNLMY